MRLEELPVIRLPAVIAAIFHVTIIAPVPRFSLDE